MEKEKNITAKKPVKKDIKTKTKTKTASKKINKTEDKQEVKTKELPKNKTNKITEVVTKKEDYNCGHKEDNIYESWLVNGCIAHRGLHDSVSPENSISAFKKAIEKGYPIELDLNPLADGTPVVFHDSKMSRMTGENRYIQTITQEEFKNIKLKNSDEHIPTFEEVLKLVDGKVPLLIEIKTQDKTGPLEKATFELLKNYNGEFAIHSFNPYSLDWFYKHAPKIWRGQLSSFFKGEKMPAIQKFVLKRMLLNKRISHPNFISYKTEDLPNRFVKKFKTLPLLAWTVQSQAEYMRVVKYADTAIFQDFIPKI